MSPGSGCGLIHLSALNGPGFVRAWSLRKTKSVPPGDFMNTVHDDACVGVR